MFERVSHLRRSGLFAKFLTAAPICFVVCTTVGCQPRSDQDFRIWNATSETVTVSWYQVSYPWVTIPPKYGKNMGYILDSICDSALTKNSLVATTASGKKFTYGPPVCNGNTWRIGG